MPTWYPWKYLAIQGQCFTAPVFCIKSNFIANSLVFLRNMLYPWLQRVKQWFYLNAYSGCCQTQSSNSCFGSISYPAEVSGVTVEQSGTIPWNQWAFPRSWFHYDFGKNDTWKSSNEKFIRSAVSLSPNFMHLWSMYINGSLTAKLQF